jgi:hypothetical protein
MIIEDDLSLWAARFPATLVPQVIQLVLDSWEVFSTTQKDEVKITQEFSVVLNKNQQRSQLPFIIDQEITLLDENGKEQIGRLDIRIIHGYIREVYFALECKRLRWEFPGGQFSSLAGEYVTEGMYRFNGKYAQGLDKGGMLGYVMDGKIDNAIEDVRKAVEKRRAELHMKSDGTLYDSSIVNSKQVKETTHNGANGKFTVYHVFLPMKSVS